MRKFFIWVLALELCWTGCAFAETLRQGTSVEIEDVCAFTVQGVRSCDVFLNQASGEAKNFIVASLSVQNLKTERFFVKAEVEARVVYDDDFEYEAAYLWPNVEGTYDCQGPNSEESVLWVTHMDGEGRLYATSETFDREGNSKGNRLGEISTGFEKVFVTQSFSGYIDYQFVYSPLDNCFHGTGYLSDRTYISRDPSKTALDPVVERIYHYVFLVPDIVAEDEGLRELVLTVDGEEYTMRF